MKDITKKKKTFIVRFIKRNMITSTTGEGYKASRENAIKRNRKSITHWGAMGNGLANYRQTFYLPHRYSRTRVEGHPRDI